jgi:hypothetical protein
LCPATVVLDAAEVQDVKSAGGSGFASAATTGVVLTVSASDAQRVVTALALDSGVIRVGVLGAGQTGPDATANLAQCSASGR